jgi:acyl transferase domain-containing protein
MPEVARRNPGVADPFRLITTAEPWPAPPTGEPRRAAVDAFGFGGTNWHLVVEEFAPRYHEALLARLETPRTATQVPALAHVARTNPTPDLFVAAGTTAQAMQAAVGQLDPAHRHGGDGPWRLAFVAGRRVPVRVDLIKHYRPRDPFARARLRASYHR